MHMILSFIFTTWWSTLGIAAAAASIPIIIHLLNRKRFRVVVWAAMRFLLAAQKQNIKRMRLEQILLLTVRTLLLLLLVLAMASVMDWAGPLWNFLGLSGSQFEIGSTGRTHKILVLDGSLSMAARKKGDAKSAFERARAQAIDIIRKSPRGDSFSVLLMTGASPRRVGGFKPSSKKDGVIQEIETKLKRHPHGNADVAATLTAVEKIINDSAGKFENTEVYFISDLQRSTWLTGQLRSTSREGEAAPIKGKKDAAADAQPLSPALAGLSKSLRVFVDVGQDRIDNLAVTDLRIEQPFITTGRQVPIIATVKNYGARDRTGVRVELLVMKAGETPPGQKFRRRRLSPAAVARIREINRNEEVSLDFEYRFKEPGEYAVRVRLESDDLALDNSRAVIVTVKKSIPVLLVNGKPHRDAWEGATEYLRTALNPIFEGPAPAELPLLSRIEPRVVKWSDFADMSERDLEPYECIFLCDVGRPGPAEARRLKYHLRRGGGVVICLGPQAAADLDRYNRFLFEDGKGILPARLLGVQKEPADHYFAFDLGTGRADFQEAPLKAFDNEDGRLILRNQRFRQYVRAVVPARSSVRTILSVLPRTMKPEQKLDKSLPLDDPLVLLWQPVLPAEPRRKTKRMLIDEQGGLLQGEKKGAGSRPKGAPSSLYRGRVALITTSANKDWTTWPVSPSYLPMMQELLRLAIAGRLREQSALVGDVLEEYLPEIARQRVRVWTPDRREMESRTQLTEEASVFRFGDTDVGGVYRVTIGSQPREHLFAVNPPTASPGRSASESDFLLPRPRCDEKMLRAIFPGWRLQKVTDPAKVDRSLGADERKDAGDREAARGKKKEKKNEAGQWVARNLLWVVFLLLLLEVVLAWHFGHYSAVSGTVDSPPASGRLLPGIVAGVAGLVFFLMAFVLIHEALTGDFLGFLPDSVLDGIKEGLDIPRAQEGESNSWTLHSIPFMFGWDDPWLAGAIGVAAVALVIVIYLNEGRSASAGYRLLLAGLRIFLVLLTLAVLLPQRNLRYDRREWPDLVILIDDSGSMGESDNYQPDDVRKAAARLTAKLKKDLRARLPKKIEALRERLRDAEDATERRDLNREIAYWSGLARQLNRPDWRPSRLQLAWAVLTLQEQDWFKKLLAQRKMKVYVYHLDRTGQAERVGELTGLHDDRRHRELLDRIKDLRAESPVSPLGTAVRKVLDDFRTSSLGAVIMLTDGNTVEDAAGDKKEDLLQVAQYAKGLYNKKGVPLFFVGIGDAHNLRDIRLLSMDAPYTVHVKDFINIDVTLQGQKDMTVPLKLYEKTKDGLVELGEPKQVKIDSRNREVRVQLRHQPKEVGEKVYVVRLDVPRSNDPKERPREDYLELQRKVLVSEAKLSRVLYIEGTPRYEYRYLKTLLEREAGEDKSNKTVDLKVVLMDADDEYAKEDKSALVDLPPNKQELFQYDMIILGDVDPQGPKIKDRLKDLADFVRERGGGLLMIAGENFSPNAWKGTPLEAVLPIEVVQEQPPEEEEIVDGFRPQLTLEGQGHPLFQFASDPGENQTVWNNLAEIFWYAKGYRTKPGARVLAVHPDRPALEPRRSSDRDAGKHPLVVYQLVGAGRSMFFGFDESWRWRLREDELRFNTFWMNTVNYVAHQRQDRITLRLNKQTPYVRGEIIQVTVRLPDNTQPPGEVKVTWKRTPRAQGGVTPRSDRPETLTLSKREDALATYTGRVSRTRVGKYHFELAAPETRSGPAPSADATVVPPEGELERLSMNDRDMASAAQSTGGKFFTLANADELPDLLPEGERVQKDDARPPSLLWNTPPMFLLALFLFGAEWLLRKRKHLL
jgi:uncharacterized membrane protein